MEVRDDGMVKTKEILIKKKNIPGYFPPFLAHAKSDFDTKMEKKKKKKKTYWKIFVCKLL